jgi:hypothetical protein
MARAFTNFARSTLASGINAGDLSLTVAAGQGALFPAAGAGTTFDCVIVNTSAQREIISVTARAADVFTIVRAQEGTIALAWNAGDRIGLRLTAAALNDILFVRDLQENSPVWCGTAGGTANGLTLTPTPAIVAYVAGQKFIAKTGASPNSGAVTIDVSGLGTVAAQDNGVAMTGGELEAAKWYEFLYDGAAFQISKYVSPIERGLLTTTGDIIYASAARVPARLAAGTAGYVLTSGGAGVAPAWASATGSLSIGELVGCTLSNNVADATNDIDISAGSRRDVLNTENMVQATALTKQLDAAWAVGTAAGMRDTGSIANGTWHLHLIKRTDTNVVDVIASLSPDTSSTFTVTIASPGVITWTAHGLVAGASFTTTTTGALPTGMTAGTTYFVIAAGLGANSFQFSATQGGAAINTSGSQSGTHTIQAQPVMPTNYTKFRRIGSILREAAAIVGFLQEGGDFWRKAPVESWDATNPGTSAVTRTLGIPLSLRLKGYVSVVAFETSGANSGGVYISDLAATDTAANVSVAPGVTVASGRGDFSSDQIGAAPVAIWTNTSAQIRARLSFSGAGTISRGYTTGWFDPRGTHK